MSEVTYLYESYKGFQNSKWALLKHVESKVALGMDGWGDSHASSLYSLSQPGMLFPYPLNVLILILLSNSSAFTISLGQCTVSLGRGLDGTDCTACTALYGRPYHALSKLHTASSLHFLNPSSLLTYMLNSTQHSPSSLALWKPKLGKPQDLPH